MAKIRYRQDIEDRIESSHHYRGKLISVFSHLEMSIEYYLRNYFMGKPPQYPKNKKHVQFIYIVLERMTFEAKRTSMKAIVEDLAKSKGFVKKKNNSYPDNKLFDEIRKLNDHRNYFAHYSDEVYINKDGLLDYAIALKERREWNQDRKFSLDEFNKLIDRIEKATDEVENLHRTLLNDNPS